MKKLLLPLLFLSLKAQGQELKIIDNFVYGTKESITKKEDVLLCIYTIRYNGNIIYIESKLHDFETSNKLFYTNCDFKIDKSLIKKEDLYDLITTKKYGDYSISDYDSEHLKKSRSYAIGMSNIITIPPFFTITKNVLILN